MSSIDSLPAVFYSELREAAISFVHRELSCQPSRSRETDYSSSYEDNALRSFRVYEAASGLDGLDSMVQKMGVMVYGLLSYSRWFIKEAEQRWLAEREQSYRPSSSFKSTLFLFEMHPQTFSMKQRADLLYGAAERGLLQNVRSILQIGVLDSNLCLAQKLALENNHIDTAWAIYCCRRGWAEGSSKKELMNCHASMIHNLQKDSSKAATLRGEVMNYLQKQCRMDARLRTILEKELQEERAQRKADLAMDDSAQERSILRKALDHNRVEWVLVLLATPHSQLSRAIWTETLLSALCNPSCSKNATVLLEVRKWSNAEVSYILRSLVQSERLSALNRVLASPLVCTKEALQRAWVFAEVLGYRHIAKALDQHLREQTTSA